MNERYRYPGINYFDTNDTDIFFGRTDDRLKLADKVEMEKTVLLYSRSGLGKTSLLKAALIPELIQRGYHPYYIKLGLYSADSISPVVNIIRNTIQQPPHTFLHKFINRCNTLWFAFKSWQIKNHQPHIKEKPIVIIFDQFEEISSYPYDDIMAFKQQLAALLSQNLPPEYQRGLENSKLLTEELTDEELDLLYTPLRIKIVFSVRSDQLSVLNKLTDYLPFIQNTFYELKPLSTEKAILAITKPAEMDGNFITEKFSFQKDALDTIQTTLKSGSKDEVDSAHLQIILQYIEKELVKDAQNKIISSATLGDLDKVYENYYHDSLNKLSLSQKAAAQKLIEDRLIANGRRISYDKEACLPIVSPEILNILVDNRLLREEPNSLGRTSYEISHDSLIKPILESRKYRKEKKKNEDLELKLKIEKRKSTRNRFFSIGMGIVCLVICILSIEFLDANKSAQANKKIAEDAKLSVIKINGQLTESLKSYINAEIKREQAEAEKNRLKILQFELNMRQGPTDTQKRILAEAIKHRDSINTRLLHLTQKLDSLNNNSTSLK